MKLLALDTASAQCSVALLAGGEWRVREVATARDHATLILPMVEALLAEAGLALRALDGIAFGRGPGSFTGVRIAAAVTQGLAAGADLGVRPVSDLRALAWQACRRLGPPPSGAHVLAAMDARMGEVYAGLFAFAAGSVADAPLRERVVAPGTLHATEDERPVLAAGRALAAYPALAAAFGLAPGQCLPEAEPHALDVGQLAVADLAAGAAWQDAASAQPVYLRDRVTHGPA